MGINMQLYLNKRNKKESEKERERGLPSRPTQPLACFPSSPLSWAHTTSPAALLAACSPGLARARPSAPPRPPPPPPAPLLPSPLSWVTWSAHLACAAPPPPRPACSACHSAQCAPALARMPAQLHARSRALTQAPTQRAPPQP
jgi:hypothetical protein